MIKQEPDLKRTFGGELNVFVDYKNHPEERWIRNSEKKHLKAYLRGDKFFSFGKDEYGSPRYFPVREIWIESTTK